MADEAREVAPVRFFNDPRLPLEGVQDWAVKPQAVTPEERAAEAEAQAKATRDPRKGVYGGKVKPTAENPVVMDRKAHLSPPPAESDRESGPPPAPAQELQGADQSPAKPDNSDKSAPDSPTGGDSVSDKPAQTPKPQTSEPTKGGTGGSATKSKSSSTTGSSSKTSQAKKGTTSKE